MNGKLILSTNFSVVIGFQDDADTNFENYVTVLGMTSGTVSIKELTIPQLQDLVRQFEQKIQFISASIQQLKSLQAQFVASKSCLGELITEKQNKDILVPLTSTLCVPGKLYDPSHVLVDIGTGYYVEMTVPEAESHFSRRVEYINKQIRKILPVLEEKTQAHKSISDVLDAKIQEFIKVRSAACS
ncbi:Prefoldin subunit 5, variant 2 [Schistosoma haematobium]|uniref:Prefoldin subunit 5 n=1 Tax=Schistosoma haematobium TaxID=6185 RepID=A0A095AXR0_SCHHA|nr:Prefoldin subunit 5, variant 2 [Schistosoma haematobium]KAH9594020.1 Prefoldin subunit 5, variant 2 [Schistosoma haematobium]